MSDLPDHLVNWLKWLSKEELRQRMLRSILARMSDAGLSTDPETLSARSEALDERYFNLREAGNDTESMEFFRQARLLDSLRLLHAGEDEAALYEFNHSLEDVSGAAAIVELGRGADDAGEETMLCPSCLAPNFPKASFCEKCDAPLNAVCDPVNQIRAQRFIFHRAATGPSSLLVVLGMWAMFFPVIVGFLLFVVLDLLYSGSSDISLLSLAESLAISGVGSALLWRVTSNYRRRRREELHRTGDPDENPAP